VSELDNSWLSVFMSHCCEKLVAELCDNLGTKRKGNIRRWRPLASNENEDLTVDTSVYVCNSEM
jgi:hypothetical protein